MDNIINSNTNFIFISPHLDDAIFSCGGLIDILYKKGKNISIVNIFTKASKKPYTISIKKFLHSCGYSDADKLYKDRIKEDKAVAKLVNAKVLNLNFTDALWRRKDSNWPIPEFNYVYPIFRLSIARGLISRYDTSLIKEIENKLLNLINENKKTVILCPSGIGNHTDHLITRNIVNKIFKNVIFWEDYPYSKTNTVDKHFLTNNNVEAKLFKFKATDKDRLVNAYKSQLNAIFGNKFEHTGHTEKYFIKKSNYFFPENILRYKFKKILDEQKHSGKYLFALYADNNKRQAILKMWKGTKPNLAYFWLKNEINAYDVLNTKKINIPQLIYSEINQSEIIALYEFINGSSMGNLNDNDRANIYSKVLTDIQNSNNLSTSSNAVTKRAPYFWILMLPFVTFKALINHPRKFRIIIKSFFNFISKTNLLLLRNTSSFVHRDLNDNNIIVSSKTVFVIDFELSCIGDPLIDIAIIYLKNIKNVQFLSKFTQTEGFRKLFNTNHAKDVLIAYIIIFAIYDLGNTDEPHELDFVALNKFVDKGENIL